MDLNRIEELINKITNSNFEIRSRAASNIAFKLNNGIIVDKSLTQNINSSIVAAVSEALNILTVDENDFVDKDSQKCKLLEAYLSIIQNIHTASSSIANIHPFSNILESLYKLKSVKSMNGKLSTSIDEVNEYP